jgi:DNA (cytosine-5)-methyltransferase 1
MAAGGLHHAIVVKNYGDGHDPSMVKLPEAEPLGTVTSIDHHSLVALPFTVDYHGHGRANSVDRPLPTQDTRDRHGLVEPAIEIDDCGFRMLEPHEIAKAMAFPDEYRVEGTKRDRVRMYGNAVTPPAMRTLVQRVLDSLAA